MLGIARARSSMIFDARNSSRRWTIATFEANFDEEHRLLHRGVAAADDQGRRLRKNAASQVAQ